MSLDAQLIPQHRFMPQGLRHTLSQALMTRILIALLCAVSCTTIVACGGSGASDGQIFTLYRNSALDENMRIHVSTFDAADGEAYNRGNCEQAELLFKAQTGVKTKFWCEKGRFKK